MKTSNVLVVVALVVLSTLCLLARGQSGTPAFKIAEVNNYTVVATSGNSTLYKANLADGLAYASGEVYVIDLHGSRYEIGYDYGYLLADQIVSNFQHLFHALIGDKWYSDIEIDILFELLEWQWNDWLSKALPQQYLEEIEGVRAGGEAAGVSRLDRYISGGITVANMPGDLNDFVYILKREWNNRFGDNRFDLQKEAAIAKEKKQSTESISGLQCSMFSVWGSRTFDASLFSGRNLDWNANTGINKNKLLTVINPEDGAYSHLSVGFAGLYGALTGVSQVGVSVMEANLEENEITFSGFPWTMRLRYIMENAANIAEGKALWEATENTVGFNHMIASAVDAGVGTHPSYALETMYNYTAYFQDDDPREQNATYFNGTNYIQIGFPLKEALWRTNHGYDPVIRAHYEWSQSPTSWSMERYMFAYEAFTSYENTNQTINYLQAVNITSILGDKGQDPYVCQSTPDGSNIISVAYHGGTMELWAAWEDGANSTWSPAACNIYVHFNMGFFWN